MHTQSDRPIDFEVPATPCWNAIGVRGDRSCPQLIAHVHCRNCPVYADAAVTLLDRPASAEGAIDHTRHFATLEAADESDTQSVVIFRVASEWFALPTAVVAEVAERRVIHGVPHRRSGTVLGLVNVRGELLVCVSLARLLGLQASEAASRTARGTEQDRLLVVRSENVRAVLAANEVCGIERFHARDLKEAPTTVSKSDLSHSIGVLSWREQVVGLLDTQRLFRTLHQSVA